MLKCNSINVHLNTRHSSDCKFGACQKWEPASRIGDFVIFFNGFAKSTRLIVLNFDRVQFVLKNCEIRTVHRMYGILFYFFINSARFRKKCIVFFSFVVRFRLVIRFYSHFFGLLVRFFPNTRFSNRSDCILRVKLSLSPRVIWSFLVVRILLAAHRTLLLFYKLLFVKT